MPRIGYNMRNILRSSIDLPPEGADVASTPIAFLARRSRYPSIPNVVFGQFFSVNLARCGSQTPQYPPLW